MADTGLPDIHAGQVVFASIRAASNSSKIDLAGKDTAGQPLTLAFETQAAETDLPKLIWMKHRIDSLLQGGKNSEAIALAKKANLVCRGVAFVAWDDAEKVTIARKKSISRASLARAAWARPQRSLLQRSPLRAYVAAKVCFRALPPCHSLRTTYGIQGRARAPFLDDASLSDAPGSH